MMRAVAIWLGLVIAAYGATSVDQALYGPEMMALRAAISNELAAAESRTREGRAQVLRQALADWETELAERRRTRNIRGIAVAEDARMALQRMLEELEKTGRVEWPSSLRRELTEPFQRLRDRMEGAERTGADLVAAAERAALERFRTAASRVGVSLPQEPDALRARFHAWLREPPPSPPAAAPGTAPVARSEAEPPIAAAPRRTEPPEFFAQSRPGADWIDVGIWRAESRGPDVYEITVFGPAGERRGEKSNPVLGRTTAWSWRQNREVMPGAYSWRLRRLGTADVVDVIEWPSPSNDGRLIFRTRMPSRLPAETAFEVQYSTSRLVSVDIRTDPPGALIEINGQPHREGLREVRTPATVHVVPGTISMKLSLDGYQDAVAPALRVDSNRTITVKLAPLKDLPGRTVTVDAQSVWTDSGIAVRRGDRVRLSIEGEWSCGARGEMTGPQGYDPRDLRFSHYYLAGSGAPKQLESAPYGALLVRIGTNSPMAVAGSRGFVASAEGPLLFDINESTDPSHRRNNRGALKLKISVQPGGAP
ncbi:MAG: PEGA domain-containing protein [Kiritimatiellae bacterium]|nr:PEGA domain-containing protein [Kiritimatiellia bacterium]